MNYLNNNLLLINEYQKLYKNGIDINELIVKFHNNDLQKHEAVDYGRFRIFIDGCMLLLNKEKYQHYSKKKCGYKDYLEKVKNDNKFNTYIESIKEEGILSDSQDMKVYLSLENKNGTPWDQIAKIRNSMAHMQYGNFSSAENGCIRYYYLYNKDKGIRKDLGIVFEPILHNLIQSFFSDYSYGVLFKVSIFSKYNFLKKRKSLFYDYYEFKLKNKYLTKYNYSNNPINELAKKSRNEKELFDYILKNGNKFTITRKNGLNYIFIPRYIKFKKKYNLNNKTDYYYGLKTLFDFNTEISNFLVHISQLNEVLYEYSIMNSDKLFSNIEKEYYKNEFENALSALKEDENAKFAFDIGFEYLNIMNFILRIEDDDYIKLNYKEVNVSMFSYDENDLKKYINNNGNKLSIHNYIIERLRNSLMHGRIDVSIDNKGTLLFIFTDKHNNREETIKITLDDLRSFLSQKCLYENVPKDTSYLIFQNHYNAY